MKITRTANAGVLIELDGVSLLIDGVCEAIDHYLGTPTDIRKELINHFPDVLCCTHRHRDHYDESYVNLYKRETLRPVLGSECSALKVGSVQIRAIQTRHIGKNDIEHFSFIIEGSRCIWFVGDASPLQWKDFTGLPKPDVLIVPFAYCNTKASWTLTKSLGAKDVLLVHMPDRENDPFELWDAVQNTTENEGVRYFTKISDTVALL